VKISSSPARRGIKSVAAATIKHKLFHARNVPLIALLVALISAAALPQRQPKYPAPPPPLSTGPDPGTGPNPQLVPSPITAKRHVDLIKLQENADELSKLSQTIPADLTAVRHSTLPKDLLDKLKRIEKLSKHLRRELTP